MSIVLTHDQIEALFFNRVLGDPNSGCWLWMGATTSSGPYGYGQVRILGKNHLAHRLFYAAISAPLGDEEFLCHKCDTPLCVRPDHMFVGDYVSNAIDRDKKRRGNFPKLNDEQVMAIRGACGFQKDIATSFGIDPSTVSLIKSGKIWREVRDV